MKRIILILAALLIASPAMAQGPIARKIQEDIAAKVASPGATGSGTIMDKAFAALAKPFQDLAAFIGDDLDAAIALSTAIPELQDGHGQQCWMAMSTFGKIVKAHPLPLTLRAATDFEALRLHAISANRLCGNAHCTQMFADGVTMAQAASPVPLVGVPQLHDLCAKIPQIALVDPVTVPAAPPK